MMAASPSLPIWCCVSLSDPPFDHPLKSSLPKSPHPLGKEKPSPETLHKKRNPSQQELPDGLRSSADLLKSGEVSNLIKQGFIEKTECIPPIKRKPSPDRVYPLAVASSATMQSLGKYNWSVNAVSPPPLPPSERQKSSSTLLEMIANDSEVQPQHACSRPSALLKPALDRQQSIKNGSGSNFPAGNSGRLFNEADSSDVKLTLRGKDGRTIVLNLHKRLLIDKSKFFAAKLSETWSKQQNGLPYLMEISDCDDLEAYQEALRLLYCRNLRSRLVKCNVSRILGILKASSLLLFEEGIASCLEFLEAVPWAEEDEEKVSRVIGQLQLDSFETADVLRRLHTEGRDGSEEVLLQLLQMIIKGRDEKARRELKFLLSRLLRENLAHHKDVVDISKESFYRACSNCLDNLVHLFMQASKVDFMNQGNEDRGMQASQIARQADNLQWLLEILIDRGIADEFVKLWAHQSELASLHKQLVTMLRFEVSHLTARLCIAVGKSQVLCPVDVRYMLLQTWLPPLVDDFGWMQRCCKGLDKNVVEEAISQTILTLPLKQQQSILLAWFDRFSNNADDCPNLQKAFEVWWRRTFVRPCLNDGNQVTS